jgi:methyltransferase (TIGR00027 family)
MRQANQPPASNRSPIAAGIYYLITLLLLPFSVIGYIFWIVKSFSAAKKSGVSGTAQGPLSARWVQDQSGVREDWAASRLLMTLPGISVPAVWLVFGPLLLAYRLTGYLPKTFRYPFEGPIPVQAEAAARQTFFDEVLERYLPELRQFVILGAGFDTRAFRLTKDSPLRFFEIDTPQTLKMKRELLAKAGISSDAVSFVPADFEKEDWLTLLTQAGFDLQQPALFIWEGVMMYLDQSVVEETLRKVASTAKGSILAFDYMTSEPLTSQALYYKLARAGTKANGEPLKFGIDSTPPSRERLKELLQACGLSLNEQRTLGSEKGKKRAWGGFAVAIVK